MVYEPQTLFRVHFVLKVFFPAIRNAVQAELEDLDAPQGMCGRDSCFLLKVSAFRRLLLSSSGASPGIRKLQAGDMHWRKMTDPCATKLQPATIAPEDSRSRQPKRKTSRLKIEGLAAERVVQ